MAQPARLLRLFGDVGLARETLHQENLEPARRADHVIIDGSPRVAVLARSALLATDRVLIPVQPGPSDLWASAEMVNMISEAQMFRPTNRCRRCTPKYESVSSSPRAWQQVAWHANWYRTAPLHAKSAVWSTSY